MDRTDDLRPGFGKLEERAVSQPDLHPLVRGLALGREAQLIEQRNQLLDRFLRPGRASAVVGR
jgi:hypothetical protein